MKKNWTLFFIIAIFAYGWMFWSASQQQKKFEAAEAQYKLDKAAYDESVRIAEEEKARKRAELQAEVAEAAGQPPAADGKPVTPEAQREIARMAAQKGLVRELLSVKDAPTHVVDTPLYRVEISELGARPISWQIKSSAYVTNIKTSDKDAPTTSTVELVPQVGDPMKREYPLQFTGSTVRNFNTELFTVAEEKSETGTTLTFTSNEVDGLRVVKEFKFRANTYTVGVVVKYINGDAVRQKLGSEQGFGIGWQGGFGDPEMADRVHGMVTPVMASAGSVYAPTIHLGDEPYVLSKELDWAGQEKKYFTVLLVPTVENPMVRATAVVRPENESPEYETKGMNPPVSIDVFHAQKNLEVSESATYTYQLYVGPKNLEALKLEKYSMREGGLSPDRVVFHYIPLKMSWLRPLCLLLLTLMRELHEIIGAWGLAIIGTTMIVRTVMYPVTHWAIKNSARTMVETQRMKPEMDELRKKFKNDPMKLNQAMMQLYRDHGTSPFSGFRGCLPALLQMPVFMALYVVFEQSVELRGQSFLWIPDLSGPDQFIHWGVALPLIGSSFNLLPILMSITNYIQMRLMQMPAQDEMQAQIQKQMMIMMPIMFTFFLYHLPSGLILYWTISNLWGIAQGWLTKRMVAAHQAKVGNGLVVNATSSTVVPVK